MSSVFILDRDLYDYDQDLYDYGIYGMKTSEHGFSGLRVYMNRDLTDYRIYMIKTLPLIKKINKITKIIVQNYGIEPGFNRLQDLYDKDVNSYHKNQ